MKTCTKCRAELPLTEFSADKRNPDGHGSWCRACKKAHHAAYDAAHREQIAAYRAANRERDKASSAAYYAANRERDQARRATPEFKARWAAYAAAYRAANSEKIAATSAAYRAANHDKEVARSAAYRAAHPEQGAALQLKKLYDLTQPERDEMFEQQRGLCACACGLAATEVDHCHDCEDISRRGSVRGLVCHPCNVSIERSAELTAGQTAYLAAHDAVCPALFAEVA